MEGDVLRAVASLTAGSSDAQTAEHLVENIATTVGASAGAIVLGSSHGGAEAWFGQSIGSTSAGGLVSHLDAVLGTDRRAVSLYAGSSVVTSLDRALAPYGVLYLRPDSSADTDMRLALARHVDVGPFTATDLDVAEAMCAVASVALAATRERDRRRRFEDWLSVMEDTATILLRGVAPRTVLEGVLDRVTRDALHATDADMAGVAMPIEHPDVLRFNVAIGSCRPFLQGFSFSEHSSLSGAVYHTEAPVVVDDALEDPRTNKSVIRSIGVGPLACGPLWLMNRVIGVIFVGNLRNGRALGRTDALDVVAGLDLAEHLESSAGVPLPGRDGIPAGDALARLRSDAVDFSRLSGLTERELDLLRYLCDGLSNPEIAAELGLAEKTVRNALTTLLAKLGVENRTQAAVFAARVHERLGRLA